MTEPVFTHRLARLADAEAIAALMELAIDELQKGFLDAEQIRVSRLTMGLDRQLIRDGTYFLIYAGDALVGCGGWSYRATLYGGDASLVARTPAVLNPAVDAARIRAMYTHPVWVRRGIGRLIIALSEAAARAAGFRSAEMMATLSGVPLYRAMGYAAIERVDTEPEPGIIVPLIRMGRPL